MACSCRRWRLHFSAAMAGLPLKSCRPLNSAKLISLNLWLIGKTTRHLGLGPVHWNAVVATFHSPFQNKPAALQLLSPASDPSIALLLPHELGVSICGAPTFLLRRHCHRATHHTDGETEVNKWARGEIDIPF